MSSSPGGAYFLAELISCCEEITSQCFPRTCGNGRGTVSQQGYLSGETEARSGWAHARDPVRVQSPTWQQGLENPPGIWSRDVVLTGLEVKTNLHPPRGTGCAGMHWAAAPFPADPMTRGRWTMREWLRSEPNPLNSDPAQAKRQPAGNSTAVSLRTGTLGMCTGIPVFCNIYAHPRTLRMILKNISRVYFFQIP